MQIITTFFVLRLQRTIAFTNVCTEHRYIFKYHIFEHTVYVSHVLVESSVMLNIKMYMYYINLY